MYHFFKGKHKHIQDNITINNPSVDVYINEYDILQWIPEVETLHFFY